MRKGISIEVSAADRTRLEAVVADRNSPQKHVWRAGIILATADGFGTTEIMRRTGKSKPCVWRWQARFMTEGVDGLLRDKTRPSRVPPLGPEVAERVVALTLGRSAGRDDPLDRRHDGEGGRHQRQLGPAHLARARPAAAPGPAVQALERSALRREAARCGRALSRPAGARHRALGRREEPDPGARPDPARPADEEGPRRHDDPRLQAARHDDAFRRAERARRHRHRPEHAAAPPPGVHPLPQHRRGCGPEGQAGPRHPRQLRRPQAPARSARGSTAIRAGPSTSCRHPAPGSTPSRASSPSSRSGASGAVSSTPSSTSRPPSTAAVPGSAWPRIWHRSIPCRREPAEEPRGRSAPTNMRRQPDAVLGSGRTRQPFSRAGDLDGRRDRRHVFRI